MVNSDFKRTYDDPFMKAFDKELKEIQKQVVNAERHKNIIECVPRIKNNYYGSAINHILCDYEANLLEDMMKVLKDNSLVPSVRMFAFYTFDVAKLKTFYKMNDLVEVEETEETD